MTTRNHRLGARNRVAKVSTSVRSLEYSAKEQDGLKACFTRTQAKALGHLFPGMFTTCMVVGCRRVGDTRSAMQTDMVPELVAEVILPMSQRRDCHCDVFVPLPESLHPKTARFSGYLLSQVVYPEEKDAKLRSIMDFVHVYAQVLQGTLNHYWSTGSESHARLAWQVLVLLRILVQDMGSCPADPDAKSVATLKQCIEKRDQSAGDADRYKQFMLDVHPARY